MRLGDIDIYNLPLWLNGIYEELDKKCVEELKKESAFYNQVMKESGELLEEYPFISTLIDRDKITEPIRLTVSEVKSLSKFLALDAERRDMETIQMYLMGSRHMMQLLRTIKVIQ
ncbi:DUF6664 family protein [Faecalicatena contorta]|uniref:DUF6664 domain-containing protein n=1 Tax=Faecalicatena contorta TaxID=39482 RepID=A0A315ZSU3_9FIRM|nr:hypothetical protein [Faecalicatena contorta]PWJ47804.1 hypothetical protein A8805_11659 [Faecalicatena contorta]SUQ15798.1 hypothetical protein SAMN05216529_11659 [Faecalicatena contorta]